MPPYKQPYGFKEEPEGGPGGGLPGIKNENIDNKEFKAGAKAFIIDNYKETVDSKTLNVPTDEYDYYGSSNIASESSNIGNEITKQALRRGRQTIKPKGKGRRRTGKGKGGSVGGSIGYSTPWKRYRAAVKDFKQKEIKEKTDPFSRERRLAKQDLRGKFDSTGRRLSAKNYYQQKYLVNRRRGRDGNTQRGFHNPNIPEFKNKVSFAEWRQNKRNQKQIDAGAVKIGGCTPSGDKFTGQYRANVRDFFGHGSQCGPKGKI